ncbi:MAG: GTP-binding protein EngA [Actinomycetota bacterium]|jgi:GTPase
MSESTLPSVVVVGRPNVGKSTLFNRIVGEQAAIVEDRPGVTRDRKALEAEWLGTRFLIVDTGGWLPGGSELDEKVSRQVEAAVREADVVLFVVDASVGLTDDDQAVAQWLRKMRIPVLVVANKADNDRRENDRWEFMALGLGEPVPVSALHGRRAGDLLDEVIARLPSTDDAATVQGEASDSTGDLEVAPLWHPDDEPPRVAIVGRPNVGKSTLFNRLVGEDRSVVHDMAGTTRDSIDTLVETPDGPIVFVDTAGMRRRSRIDDSAEYYSMVRALRAIDDADIALLVIDATEGVTSQDQRLAERVDASGCPIVVMLNKWELVDDADDRAAVTAELERKLFFVGDSPVLKISALTGKGVHKLRPVLQEAIEQYRRRVPTRDVNRVIADAQQRQPAGHGLRVLYALQGATDPPTFTLFANRELPATYLRYLERSIREAFGLGATPIKLRVRKRSE